MATHPLDGTAWRLVANRAGTQLEDTPPEATVTLRFHLRSVGGKSAINQYHGSVEFTPDSIDATVKRRLTFSDFASTMMAGPEHLMALEAHYLELLQTVQSWSMEDEYLKLDNAAGEVVLRFERDTGQECLRRVKRLVCISEGAC
jgi:heat shock protein HslJ